MKRFEIHVTGKQGIFDPAGQNSMKALANLGFEGVTDVKIGKYIQIEADDSVTKQDVVAMCEKLLANPVIEDFQVDDVKGDQ